MQIPTISHTQKHALQRICWHFSSWTLYMETPYVLVFAELAQEDFFSSCLSVLITMDLLLIWLIVVTMKNLLLNDHIL